MKLVIGFDSWTTGSHHYEKLVSAFEKKGYQLLLIHIGSWGHDKNRPSEEYIGKLKVRDISYYTYQSFLGILVKEKPEAVIFLSTRAFAHQAFNRYANHLNIPTVHLAHGLVGVQVKSAENPAYKTNYRSLFSTWTRRIGKNVTKLMPCYMRALIDTKASTHDWFAFVKELYDKAFGKNHNNNLAPFDAKTTIGLIYTKADIPFFRDGHHLDEKDIYIVGNPDLIRFDLQKEDFGIGLDQNPTDNKEIIYIDTALMKAGLIFHNEAEYVSHLAKTHRQLAEQGYQMIVKLHPSHVNTGVPASLTKRGIEICQNADFVNRLKKCTAAMVEPSSAAMIPALMGKPLLLVQYDKFTGQRFGAVLTNYPRARFLQHLGGVANLLEAELSELNLQAFNDWFSDNSGPLPAHAMPDRVAEAVVRTVESSAN